MRLGVSVMSAVTLDCGEQPANVKWRQISPLQRSVCRVRYGSESNVLCLSQIEALEEVERAFVHVDYASRELPEHKVSAGARIFL